MKTNVDLIHSDFIVGWNYLCTYASGAHIYTLSSHTQTPLPNGHLFEQTQQLVGWFSNSKVRCLLIQREHVTPLHYPIRLKVLHGCYHCHFHTY